MRATLHHLPLGAPGIYELPEERVRALTGVRMDVCAFVGVAPRGPARVPHFRTTDWLEDPLSPEAFERQPTYAVAVPVESWDEYRRLYGAFEGPGRLPYAVAAFFENGGRRAYIVRVVHRYYDPGTGTLDETRNRQGVARSAGLREITTDDPRAIATDDARPITTDDARSIELRARNEGSWGNALVARLSFQSRPLATNADDSTLTELRLDATLQLPVGSLLRFRHDDGLYSLRFVVAVRQEWLVETSPPQTPEHLRRPPRKVRYVVLDRSLTRQAVAIEVVDASLEVSDGDGRSELHERLGLSSEHPRWLARVVVDESSLVLPNDSPVQSWIDREVVPTPDLVTVQTLPFFGGEDRFPDIAPNDFFDDSWIVGNELPGSGMQAIAELEDVSLLAVPDLYVPMPLQSVDDVRDPPSFAGPDFDACVKPVAEPLQLRLSGELDGLFLDPRIPGELATIVQLQQQLVAFAESIREFVVLLDVPPRLSQHGLLRWRAQFSSTFAVGYHPWLRVARKDDRRDGLVRINPSGVAAGIIAQRELALGIPFGPANTIAVGVVDVEDRVPPARHDELHQAAINVYLAERDGIRLTAARTLGRDPTLRQLSVRRLMTMLRRVIEQQLQWMVFEPNNRALRDSVRHMMVDYLRQLYRNGAFRGVREDEAFFVRCDDSLNPQRVLDAGQLICEIGVAPTEPLEFIVLHVTRDGDGLILVEADRG